MIHFKLIRRHGWVKRNIVFLLENLLGVMFFSKRVVIIMTLILHNVAPHRSSGRRHGFSLALDDSSTQTSPKWDESMVERILLSCGINTNDIEDVVKNLAYLSFGETVHDSNHLFFTTGLLTEETPQNIAVLSSKIERCLLDHIENQKFSLNSRKKKNTKRWYDYYLEQLFGWYSSSRRRLVSQPSQDTTFFAKQNQFLSPPHAPPTSHESKIEPHIFRSVQAVSSIPDDPSAFPGFDEMNSNYPKKLSPTDENSDNAVFTAVVLSVSGTSLVATLIFILYNKCRSKNKSHTCYSLKDEQPFLTLSLSDYAGSSKKSSSVRSSIEVEKLGVAKFKCESLRFGNASSLSTSTMETQQFRLLSISRSFADQSSVSTPEQSPSQVPPPPLPLLCSPSPPPPPPPPPTPPPPPSPPFGVVTTTTTNSMNAVPTATVVATPPPPPRPPPPPPTSRSPPPPPPPKAPSIPNTAPHAPAPPPPPISRKGGAPPPPPKALGPPRPRDANINSSRAPRPPYNVPKPPLNANHDANTDGGNKTKLKPFFWDKVVAHPNQSMVWDQIKSGSFQFNEEMIESLFGYTPSNKLKTEGKEKSSKGSQYIRILDPKKSQNLAISLKALNVKVGEVCDALMEGNELPIELLQTLLKMAPTTDEELRLRLYTGDPLELGPAEQFLKDLVEIPFAFQRLDVLLFMSSLQEEYTYVKESFSIIEVACEELKKTRLFLKLLEAVLKAGNRMNDGTFRGGAHAFKLDTLLKLADVKGVDGKTTLLHFVVKEIIRAEGLRAMRIAREKSGSISSVSSDVTSDDVADDLLQESEDYFHNLGLKIVSGLGGELENVKKAACLDSDALTNIVATLNERLVKTRGFLNTSMKNSAEESGFHHSLKCFVERAETDTTSLLEHEKRVRLSLKKTTDFFHGKEGKDEGLQLFVIVRNFLGMLEKACKEISEAQSKPTRTVNREAPSASPARDPRQLLAPALKGRRKDSSSSESSEDEN